MIMKTSFYKFLPIRKNVKIADLGSILKNGTFREWSKFKGTAPGETGIFQNKIKGE